jgi:hypothetical protein
MLIATAPHIHLAEVAFVLAQGRLDLFFFD